MSGKEKLFKSLSTGVVALVFLLLIVQFVFFSVQALHARANSKSAVSSETVAQVKPWWEMPVELNGADSVALVSLKGIGPYFALKILDFREKLGGSYASIEQLLDVKGIDSVKFSGFKERVYIDTTLIIKIDLYSLPYDSLVMHPYIGPYAAKGIVRMRKSLSKEEFSIDELVKNKVLPTANGERLKLYCK